MTTWKTLSGRSGWIPWTVFALLSARLLARVSRLAVDLPFADQWDLWNPLFAGDGPWTFFRFQFGPVRQGLGGIVMLASASASGWSTRAETFVSAGFVIVGSALFLVLARRIRGGLDALDAVLPLILLNGLVADAIAEVPNPAHGPVPFFLLCAAPLCFAIRRAAIRLPLLVLLTVTMAYTHFAIVAVPLVLCAQAIEVWRSERKLPSASALLASLLLSLTFLIGYQPHTAAPCFAFPDPHPGRYLPFAASVLARPLYLPPGPGWPAVAALLLLAVATAATWSAWRMLRQADDELHRAVFLLSGAALLFAGSSAIGRVCLGQAAAYAPRYIPYVLPGLAAAALLLRTRLRRGGRWLAAALLVLCLAQQVGFELRRTYYEERTLPGKRRLLACLRFGWTARQCILGSDFPIYPDPVGTRLEEKVEFMRARQLGPFRPDAR